ncbi:hypothetical protein D9M69_389430 [compost metagenome]
MRRRIALGIQRKVLVVKVDAWVIKVRAVLAMVLVGGLELVWLLVEIIYAVVEEPVTKSRLF